VRVVQELQRHYEIVTMSEHARRLVERGPLPVRRAA
jgi:hypothetical protein